jgi:hypothetical protein
MGHERIDLPFAAELNPFVLRRKAVRARALRRVAKKFAARAAALRRQFVLAQTSPKRLGFRFLEEWLYFADGSSAVILCVAHSAPKIILACTHRLPP